MFIAYLARHGRNVANILTAEGAGDANAAATAIKVDMGECVSKGVMATVYSSPEPRACQTAAIMAAVLGLKITMAPKAELEPAKGLAAAIKTGQLPQPGQGFAKSWKEQRPKGVEDWIDVYDRCWRFILLHWNNDEIVVAATHGGVIEPATDGIIDGSDLHDLTEGEVAVFEKHDDGHLSVRFLNQPAPAEPMTDDEILNDPRR